jgi:hypothetical protein
VLISTIHSDTYTVVSPSVSDSEGHRLKYWSTDLPSLFDGFPGFPQPLHPNIGVVP